MRGEIATVAGQVAAIRLERAREFGKAQQGHADETAYAAMAERHTLSARWRIGILLAACGGVFGGLSAIVGLIRLATGH